MPNNHITTIHSNQIQNTDQRLELRLDKLGLSMHEIIAIAKRLKHTPIISDRATPIPDSLFKALSPYGIIDIEMAQYNSRIHQGPHPLILSSHQTSFSPKLPDIPHHYFKVCPKPKNMTDCLQFLVTAQNYPQTRTIAYARGIDYVFTRHLAQRSHQPIHFTAHDQRSAQDGQLIENSSQNLNIAQYWLAVIGHNIAHSKSPDFHNDWIVTENLPAYYICLDIKPEEIEDCIPLIQKLPFMGFSITSPYKQLFAKQFNAKQPVINTLIKHNSSWECHNTDQNAFMELSPKANKILILGAGSCALAIAEKINKPIHLWARPGRSREYFLENFPNTQTPTFTQWDLIICTLPSQAHTKLPRLKTDTLLDLQYQSPPPKQIQHQKLLSGELFFKTQAIHQKKYFKEAIIKKEL